MQHAHLSALIWEPFRLAKQDAEDLPSEIARSLSPRDEVSFEISFSCEATADRQISVTVSSPDCLNSIGLIFDTMLGRISAQVESPGERVITSECVFPCKFLKNWRFWLSIDHAGGIELRYEAISVLSMKTAIDSRVLRNVRSDCSCCLSINPLLGYSEEPSKSVSVEASRDAHKFLVVTTRSEAHFEAPRVELFGKWHATKVVDEKVAFDLIWRLYSLIDMGPLLLAEPKSFNIELNGERLHRWEARHQPSIRIGAGWFGILLSADFRKSLVQFSDNRGSRIVSPAARLNFDGMSQTRFSLAAWQWSQFIELFDGDTKRIDLDLRIADLEQYNSAIRLQYSLMTCIETVISRTNSVDENSANQSMMILLDIYSNLESSSERELLFHQAPQLLEWVSEARLYFGTGTRESFVRGAGATGHDQTSNVSQRDSAGLRFRLALDVVANVVVQSESPAAELLAELRAALEGLNLHERTSLLLIARASLFDLGLEEYLWEHFSKEYAEDFLLGSLDPWSVSAATSIFATKGELQIAAALMDRLNVIVDARNLDRIDLDSVARAVHYCNGRGEQDECAVRIVRAGFRLAAGIKRSGSNRFRHDALQRAILDCANGSPRPGDMVQAEQLRISSDLYSHIQDFTIDVQLACSDRVSTRSTPGEPLIAGASDRLESSALEFDRLKSHWEGAPRGEGTLDESLATNFIALSEEEVAIADAWIRLLCSPGTECSAQLPSAEIAALVRRRLRALTVKGATRETEAVAAVGRAAIRGQYDDVRRLVRLHLSVDRLADPLVVDPLYWCYLWTLVNDPDVDGKSVDLGRLMVQAVLERTSRQNGSPILDTIALAFEGLRPTDGRDSEFISILHQAIKPIAGFDDFRNFGARPVKVNEKSISLISDTIIAVISCEANLSNRVEDCLRTWIPDAIALGARVVVFCGGNGAEIRSDELSPGVELITLPVGDKYEDLPEKILAVVRWILDNSNCAFALKVDDDCYINCDSFFSNLCHRNAHYFGRRLVAFPETFDRKWHQGKSENDRVRSRFDTSPVGTQYADGGGAYVLSRDAMGAIIKQSATPFGLQLRIASKFEDKLVGDLLGASGIELSSDGYSCCQIRGKFSGATPVLQVDRGFFPSALSDTAMVHLDGAHLMRSLHTGKGEVNLNPKRLFPLQEVISLGPEGNMLEWLETKVEPLLLAAATHVCVSVVRNEMAILPHFLEHYRKLGVQIFFFIDNLSTDGTREFLQRQFDVVLFSASSPYSKSRFGVVWQKTILDHYCVGRWVVVADADEFLLTGGLRPQTLQEQCKEIESSGSNAAIVLMIDMYPRRALSDFDPRRDVPQASATCFDKMPVRMWPFNRGPFGNLASCVSSLRHRLLPFSSPESYTSQKLAVFRYDRSMEFSEGFHFGTGMRWSSDPLAFLHYKYTASFFEKVGEEIDRGQHYDNAREYVSYGQIFRSGSMSLWDDEISLELQLSRDNPLDCIVRASRWKILGSGLIRS